MSSQRRINPSRANGAKSKEPKVPPAKMHSSLNALRHSLLANCLLIKGEPAEDFQIILQMHLDRLQPNDGVEHGIVEEMVAAKWRIYRAWTIETEALEVQRAPKTKGGSKTPISTAFAATAESPATPLLQRYEARLQLMYQRALRSFILIRSIPAPDPADVPPISIEPSPISEHPPKRTQPTDPAPLSTKPPAPRTSTSAAPVPANPPAKPPADPYPPLQLDWPVPKSPGGPV